METISTIEALEAHYSVSGAAARNKVVSRLTPKYTAWIARSKLCLLCTVGPEGVDGSPRGDDGPVVEVFDEHTVLLPDWRGNNRLDSLRNIVRDPRVSLVFFVAGSNNVVRLIGKGAVTADADLRSRFDRSGKKPATVTVITIEEIYSQCARALMRARIWLDGDQSAGLPTVGELLAEATDGALGGEAYDAAWPARARETMW